MDTIIPNHEVTNLEQAELVMRRAGIVQDEMVEGKQLLEVCGFSLNSSAKEIKRQIEKHRFIEGSDFRASMPESTGGRPGVIYHFTINAANHVLLAAMTPEGKKARQEAIDDKIDKQSDSKEFWKVFDDRFGNPYINQPPVDPYSRLTLNLQASQECKASAESWGFEGNQALMTADRLTEMQVGFSLGKL